jgi:apolipoprotein N-acyltransferase
VGLGIIIVALILGAVRTVLPVAGPREKVGLIASDETANVGVATAGADAERLFRDYATEAEKLTAQGAQVIVLPEKLAVVSSSDSAGTDAIFQSLADRTKATIVVGVVHVSPPLKYNEARIYQPGASVLLYHKHHMLPPFESNLTPGTTLTTLPQASATWGVAICKDMDFTPLSRQYAEYGAGLMLVPAWDFELDRAWHGHMAILRGVEDGFSVVRAAKDGYLTVSDDRGRILAETRSDSAPFASLLASVPATHQTTLYLLLGDWFGWVAIGIFLLTLIRLRSRRNHAGS